VLFN
jgi:ABC-type multidrug transport system fused ATPase/permease subunit